MKKVALVFVLAVFVPSLVLAWLAMRSLRDQQFVLERQQSLLYQSVADALAKEAQDILTEELRAFGSEVEAMLANEKEARLGPSFDGQLRGRWPLAEVGFVVTTNGSLLCPTPAGDASCRDFLSSNGKFLVNKESAEVYWNAGKIAGNNYFNNDIQQQQLLNSQAEVAGNYGATNFSQQKDLLNQKLYPSKSQNRQVVPQQNIQIFSGQGQGGAQEDNRSRLNPAEAEFRQLIGDDTQGTVARFVDNRLALLFWHRPEHSPGTVYGAQIALPRLIQQLQNILTNLKAPFDAEICVALLDDNAKPVSRSHRDFQGNWKRPFVATEIGEALPHWEIGVYLLNPAKLTEAAHTARLTLGLLIGVLVVAIAVGSTLIVRGLNLELKLARQKTDFVSNVSHELKTPLTSIRMFSELLADGRVEDKAKQRSYLNIITAEAARLTRLINNVLDFSRMERGEKKYNFQQCDLTEVARGTAETFRPHLEASGFKFDCKLPDDSIQVNGDSDALSQIIVNLLSNAEKYSNGQKEIELEVSQQASPLPHVEIKVLDRGTGVPRGCEGKIFEKFYRAHDSLGSGIQGSGLGLTITRQIARAHGGDVVYESRTGGGSCFVLRLPLARSDASSPRGQGLN